MNTTTFLGDSLGQPGMFALFMTAEDPKTPRFALGTHPRVEVRLTVIPATLEQVEPPWWWVLAQLAALSFHIPVMILVSGRRTLVEPTTMLALGAIVLCVAFLVYLAARRALRSGWVALAVVSVSLIFFWHWPDEFDYSWLAAILFYALAVAGAASIAANRLFRVGALAVSTTFVAGITAFLLVETFTAAPAVVEGQGSTPELVLSETPDITLIILDGYGRADVMREMYEYDNSGFLSLLQAEGFQVAERSTSPYSMTHLALPSLLEMSFVHEPGDHLSFSDQSAVRRIISGDNQVVGALKEAGFQYVHAEADSRLHSCGQEVDLCLPGLLLDLTAFETLQRTPLGPLLYPISGDPNTALNSTRIDTLRRGKPWGEPIDSAEPTFTFFHLMLPHPPMFLDATCNLRVDRDLDGSTIHQPGTSGTLMGVRRDAWVDQVRCANEVVLDYLDVIGDEEVVVLVSDHGPDSLFGVTGDLNENQILERLSNLTAVRLPDHCQGQLPGDVQLQNVFRVVLGCLAGRGIDLLPNRTFVAGFRGPIVEIDP